MTRVVVTGPPASGKTALARANAAGVGRPLLAEDDPNINDERVANVEAAIHSGTHGAHALDGPVIRYRIGDDAVDEVKRCVR